MKVLFVVSGNVKPMPFIHEQGLSLEAAGCSVEYFYLFGNGVVGYLRNLPKLRRCVRDGAYDLLHAHYGLSGLLSVLQGIAPVVITFHGSDVYLKRNRPFSFLASKLAAHSIFVNGSMPSILGCARNYSIIPCGVDQSIFFVVERRAAREQLGLKVENKYILFASSFDNPVKNYPLARDAVSLLTDDVFLLELKGCTRQDVCLLLNACDLLLMTSFSEGSPQVVKEALACGAAVVSTDVGDVSCLLLDKPNCYVADASPKDVSAKIIKVLDTPSLSRECLLPMEYTNDSVAKSIYDIYQSVISRG